MSLDEPIGDEGDTQLGDFLEDTWAAVAFDALDVTFLQAELQRVLATLSDREAGVTIRWTRSARSTGSPASGSARSKRRR